MADLAPGTVLKTTEGGSVSVDGSTQRHGAFEVHNFEVQGQHNYYVSAQGVLVHNGCGYDLVLGTNTDHVLENSLARFADEYASAGGAQSELSLPTITRFDITQNPEEFEAVVRGANRILFNTRNIGPNTPITEAEMDFLLNNRDLWDKVYIFHF